MRVRLTAPFLAVGACAGGLAASFTLDGGMVVPGAILCATLLALVGRGLTASPKLVTLATALAGAGSLAGCILAFFAPGRAIVPIGGLAGFAIGLLCFPACAAILIAARAAERVRPGTIAGRSAERRVVVATAGSVTAGTLFGGLVVSHVGATSRGVVSTLGVIGLAVLGASLAKDLGALRELRRLLAGALKDARVPDGPVQGLEAAQVVDLGAGDAERVVVTPRATAYRDAPRVSSLVRGAPGEALEIVGGSIGLEALAIALALVLLGVNAHGTQSSVTPDLPPAAAPPWRVLEPTAPDAERARVMSSYALLPRSASAAYRVTVAASTCIERVDGAVRVYCTESHPEWKVGLVVQPGERMALVYWLAPSSMRYDWVFLETGEVIRKGEVLGASDAPMVGVDGIALVPIYGGAELAAVDLMRGSVGRVTATRGKLVPIAWREGELIVVRDEGDAFEVLAVDPRAALREPP